MTDNPFTYGNPISSPSRFRGRQYEVGEIFSRLRNKELMGFYGNLPIISSVFCSVNITLSYRIWNAKNLWLMHAIFFNISFSIRSGQPLTIGTYY